MQTAFTLLIFAALAGVVFVLGWGLFNMFRGGNSALSQKLMRARVIIQFVALILLMLAAFFFAPKG